MKDTIKDGIEDRNRNGRIDGDNGDGIYSNNEVWTETNPNSWDTDQDSIRDNKEIEFGYNPLSKDSDNDGLNDTEEDKNRNGILDPGETDPTKMDTDGDGMSDKMELDGWTVSIVYEATREHKIKYTVSSNPRLVDTDGDGINDFDEYKNVTDPTKIDTDGDGKTDYEELNGDFNSSATGIDGEPPTIWKFDCQYKISFDRYLGIKIPSGLKVSIDIGVKDIFGLNYVAIYISGLPDVIKYCNNSVNISNTFEWELTGIDQYARAFVKGFKINLTAMDRNGNIGFKNDELKSIAEIVVSAYLGALLSIAKFVTELASGILNWILDSIKSLIMSPINMLLNVIIDAIYYIIFLFQPIVDFIKGVNDISLIDSFMDIFNLIWNTPIFTVFSIILIAINALSLLSLPYINIIGILVTLAVDMIVPILINALGSAIGGVFEDIANLYNNPIGVIFLLLEKSGLFGDQEQTKDSYSLITGGFTVFSLIFSFLTLIYSGFTFFYYGKKSTVAFNEWKRITQKINVYGHKEFRSQQVDANQAKLSCNKMVKDGLKSVILAFFALFISAITATLFFIKMDDEDRLIFQAIFAGLSILISAIAVSLYKKAEKVSAYLLTCKLLNIPKWIVTAAQYAAYGSLIFSIIGALAVISDIMKYFGVF
ncbi:MAG: hypothetical protein QCI82_00865 [Candidatus Thermoplasmatota archaeon]|nr:hypothetical protein [Candidatus Thermoplasmatota archaeon]